MKKKISLLLLLSVLIASCFCFGISAQQSELPENDSLYISPRELAQIKLQVGEDSVVKAWLSGAVGLFADGLSLQEIISPPYALEAGYIHASKGDPNVRIAYIRNDETFGMEARGVTPKIFFDYICDQPYLFCSTPATNLTDVEVFKLYCILSADAANGVLIYYNTNQGDFVYYLPHEVSQKEYLLPIEAFYEAVAAYKSEMDYEQLHNPDSVGMFYLDTLQHYPFDMSPYVINYTSPQPPIDAPNASTDIVPSDITDEEIAAMEAQIKGTYLPDDLDRYEAKFPDGLGRHNMAKIYSIGSPFVYFQEGKDFKTMIANRQPFYVLSSYDSLANQYVDSTYVWRDGKFQRVTIEHMAGEKYVFWHFFEKAEQLKSYFATTAATKHLENVEIQESYYFFDGDRELSIYLVTDQGDYIYHLPEPYWKPDMEYLMPVEVYRDACKLIYSELVSYYAELHLIGCKVNINKIHQLYDLQPYVVGEKDIPSDVYFSGRSPEEVAAHEKAKQEQNAGDSGENNDTPDESGCKSAISGGAGVLLLCGAALTLITKKKGRSL